MNIFGKELPDEIFLVALTGEAAFPSYEQDRILIMETNLDEESVSYEAACNRVLSYGFETDEYRIIKLQVLAELTANRPG